MTTHYDRLGVKSTASREEIRLAYLGLARRSHPDTRPNAAEAERAESNRTMAAINAAWFVLRDPDRRRLYDQSLDHLLQVNRPQPGPAEPGPPEWEQDWQSPLHDYSYGEEFTGHDITAGIARLWAFVLTAVVIMLAALFAYAFVKSGSVGTF
ncbi:MAG: J domain-containing protein [Actinomycetota bacterium]